MTNKTRKTITQLRADYNKYRNNLHKAFVHNKSGEEFQILAITWDEETNHPMYMYCYSSMSWMKFNKRCDEFLQRFHERGSV